MDKKPLFVILLLIFSMFLVAPPPMAKADGSISAQEVNAEFYITVSPPAYDGTGDTRANLEDDFRGAPLNITDIQDLGFDLEIYETTAKMRGTDTASQLMKMAVYEYLAWNDGGALYGSSQAIAVTDGISTKTFTYTIHVSIPSDDDWVFIGCIADSGAGTIEIDQDSETGAMRIYDTAMVYPGFDDPLVEELAGNGTMYLVRGKFYGNKTAITSINQYYGTIDDYTARRDVAIAFPPTWGTAELNVTYPKTEQIVNITYSNGGYWNASLDTGEYTLIDYNSTHNILQIQDTEIVSYGGDYRLFTETYDYNYNLLGLYLENGTRAGSVTVISHAPSNSTEYEIDGEQGIYTDEKPIQFTWSLSGGGSRKIYTYDDSEDIYIFTPDDDYAAYSFYIKDYTGSIGSGDTFLEALRVVNGTERVVERVLIWDTVNSVPLTLTIGKVYILQAKLYDGTTYRFGYFTPSSDPTPTLTISGIPFSDQAHYVGEHISVEATRPNATHIQTAYENLLEDTTTLLVEICYMNGTQIWNDTTLNDDIVFNWYDADNETDYLVNIEAYSEFYGDISYSKALAGEKTDITDPPDLDAVLGSGVRLMISIFIIYMGFIIFSAYTAVLGVFSGLVITYILNFMNFIPIPIPWNILHALMGLLIMWALAGGNK